tara:strand:- start:14852 stop:15070 length:219 start_codon:yes stop_codon:yes gene_type:complete
MKKKFLGLSMITLLFVGVISLGTTQDAVAQVNHLTQAISQEGSKGDLYGNAEGTKYCCKASEYKECGASACP